MYNYIFFVLYKHNLKDGKGSGRYNGSLAVGVALIIHIAMLLSLFKKIFPESGLFFNSFLSNKSTNIIFIILSFILVFLYYDSKRIEQILKRKENNNVSRIDFIKVILILVTPFILMTIIYKVL